MENDNLNNENENSVNTDQVKETYTVNAVVESDNDGKGFSIAALVLGILGVAGGFIPVVCYFTTVCAILGIIFGVKGRKMSVAVHGKASGLATAGLVLGIIGTATAAVGIICVACLGAAVFSSIGSAL